MKTYRNRFSNALTIWLHHDQRPCNKYAHIVGCDNVLSETGVLSSPGYGTPLGYPGYMQCSWTLRAPSEDRSITIVFEDFDLELDMDFLTVSLLQIQYTENPTAVEMTIFR